MMTPEQAVFAAIICCVAGAVFSLVTVRLRSLTGWLAFGFTLGSAALVTIAAVGVLSGSVVAPANRWLAAGAACQQLRVDGLSTVFLLLAAALAPLAALFSIRYLRLYARSVARYYPFFLLFVASLYGLFSTAETTWFLTYWQLMVLSGYLLIRFDPAAPARGANRFLIWLEIAAAAIVAAMATLAGSTPAILLLLLGFGITMGIWPFGQMWLPHASPAAPAPVSVLFCGVLIKVGVYGVIRYFLFLLPANAGGGFSPGTWGMLIAVLGTITLFTGTMAALQQEQSKRLLAFHSIGQTGYMLLAVGTCLALVGKPGTAAPIASFALLAALFHVVNHALFSSSLYFNAGSVLQATGTQDLNQLGGLMKYMPLTGLTALVGSLSISGMPLFNGFASKWAIFVTAIQGTAFARYLAVCAVIAILTSGLTLASFIKWFGATFLSRTSDLVRKKTALKSAPAGAAPGEGSFAGASLEIGWSMQLPQLLLSLLCVLLGLAPGLVFAFLRHALAASPHGLSAGLARPAPLPATALAAASAPPGAALFWPLPLLALFAASFLIAYAISRLGSAPRRAAQPWLCGYAREAECGSYVAHNFYGEIKRRFHWLGGLQDGKTAAIKGRAT